MRSPICCVLGHVDSGKTSLLDRLRSTKIQPIEDGGITQTISAWNLWKEDISHYLDKSIIPTQDNEIPGILMIDTPGHAAFRKFRANGTNFCDIAILVIDITKGIQKTTLESLALLKKTNTPFIVALNKLDRITGWDSSPEGCFKLNLDEQKEENPLKDSIVDFEQCSAEIRKQFEMIYMNSNFQKRPMIAELYYENSDPKHHISMVPVSAKTGEGFPDLLSVILSICETHFSQKLKLSTEVNAVKGFIMQKEYDIKGFGNGYQVLLVNGTLKKGDFIHCSGADHKIKALLGVDNNKVWRFHPKEEILGCRIVIVVLDDETRTDLKFPGTFIASEQNKRYDDRLSQDKFLEGMDNRMRRNNSGYRYGNIKGIWIQAPSVGALAGIVTLIDKKHIDIAGYSIGPIRKTDIIKASNTDSSIIANFGSKMTKDVITYAEDCGVCIIADTIVYSLVDRIEEEKKLRNKKRNKVPSYSNLPPLACKLTINNINSSSSHIDTPIHLGVNISAGRTFTVRNRIVYH